ncbi:NUDIX domain-containing protein [Peterkaempfera bronchialis]|uniref:NUDIX domain-containing protein n=1 Tax=Peterkaempfera bronchialis TaxID=2126346 RepID=A0A345SSB4_9ACTN|nr:NUDIX domain-containing protein [Peterkaempfera bronchialis]AXI76619.1 NUDIX domain-containing protein [Peterkaempfera bronchialis]
MTADQYPAPRPAEGSHCTRCGTPYTPGTATWPRRCPGCGALAYRNPLPVAVALLPVRTADGATALTAVRRTIEPGRGLLALPGGFIDHGETWQQAVTRELAEETGIHADPARVRLADAHTDTVGSYLLLFGLLPPLDLADLPPSTPTDETDGHHLLTAPTDLAFPLHTLAAHTWFTGGYPTTP